MKKTTTAAERYEIKNGKNGAKYVTKESVGSDKLNCSVKNSKLGPCLNYGFSIEYTCNHCCECYNKGKCYGCHGFFGFGSNQKRATENYNFFVNNDIEKIVKTVNQQIAENGLLLCRWFEIGDIINNRMLAIIVRIAVENPNVKFWFYTKKYGLVNRFVDENGLAAIPENLTIIFSHWMNEDGSYFPMDNKYDFPVSEYIPIGKEEEIKVTHICPCSDPNFLGKCATCPVACRNLKHGESMGLLEHSTKETKKRDAEIKRRRDEIKKAM